ncbi:metallophosphoesterase [Tautonia sociabilis]|uniref:Metallophosphoesterase n=1 Tax=Tautonia sociabilis TaxID=2080755 RepID=A0A432MMV3_9BACT|nr:metallophosphoesterase [Tautonia sociabilis]RUL88773.1 metallophosphoesterase [Tautonia sociabilis]
MPGSSGSGREGGLLAGPPGWRLAPEGAAVFESERVAVVADVHLGYEWARGSGGDMVPEHSLRETLARLDRLLSRVSVDRLVVAGDLVESPSPCPRTFRDVALLASWLAGRGVSLVRLAGNHDGRRQPPLAESLEVGGWTVAHGHRPIPGPRVVFGHHHPSLRAGGISAPCFLFDDRTLALPAFSPNAAGLDVGTAPLPPAFLGKPLRCVAGAGGEELLDFGPLDLLRGAIAARLR